MSALDETATTIVANPTYITPITCPNCGGKAVLARRAPIDGGEERIFECVDCKKQTSMITD
jgi:DNA-directed RNA polymerase subunit RPC12/RpoP